MTAEDALALVDPRLRDAVSDDYRRRRSRPPTRRALGRRVVLVGHRAAGKTTLLPCVAALLGWPGMDLDAEVERALGRPIREVFAQDEAAFRAAERDSFRAIPAGRVVAAGGGFLALHADLLDADTAVLVPISFETYRARLIGDTARPRLMQGVSLEEELRRTYEAREALHQKAPAVLGLAEFLAGLGEAAD